MPSLPTTISVDAFARRLWRGKARPVALAMLFAACSSQARTQDFLGPVGEEIAISPGTQIQQVVNQNPPGTRFLLKAGVHTGQAVTPKDAMVFRGEPGTVMDGQHLTKFAFAGGAVGVLIQDLEITGYLADSTLGAIQGYDARGWTLQNLNVHHNATYGANLRNDFRVLGGTFHHNGRLGIGVTQGANGLIDGVDLSFNNPDTLFDPLWEAGGIKISISDDVTVHGCAVHDNVGPGIWYDGDNRGSVVSANVVTGNTQIGIMYEISLSAVIQGNTISGNGSATTGPNGAGILVSASQDVEVHHNVLVGNANGIIGLQEERGSGRYGRHLVTNLWVHDNDVTLAVGTSGLLDFIRDGTLYTRNNRFDHNAYNITGNSLPFWIDALIRVSRAAWQARGLDPTSTFTGP